MERTIKRTKNYTIFERAYEGQKLAFRRWHSGEVDIMFDDTFAKACGYCSAADMVNTTIGEQGKQEIISRCGYLPSWVRVMDDGKVYFVGETLDVIGEA